MHKLLRSLVLATIAVAPVTVAAQAPVVTPAATPAPVGKSKVICRTLDTTGSRVAKRKDCRTAAEWEEARANYRLDVDRFQMNRTTTGN